MIVKREGGGWAVIRQMDHAVHCGGIARAWRTGPAGEGSVSASLEYAAAYHDLGWVEADAQPRRDPDGNPRNFTMIDEATHTRFYSGAVRTIAETDPAAAYLVSLHASGLYSRRYGWTGLKPVDWTRIGPHGKALLSGEREYRGQLLARMSPEQVEFEAAWRDYMLLETFDYLSLLTCLSFESQGCGPVPTIDGQWENLKVRRLGTWEVELDPFPFADGELAVTVEARHIEGDRFGSDAELREALAAAPFERRQTLYRAAG